MTLLADAGEDEARMFAMEAEEVRTGVVIDRRVFGAGRRWSRL